MLKTSKVGFYIIKYRIPKVDRQCSNYHVLHILYGDQNLVKFLL